MILKTLGGLGIKGSDFNRPKPLLLLTYLALQGPQDRRRLAEIFWVNEKDPLDNLRNALSLLRKGVPGSIQTDGAVVWTTTKTDTQKLITAIDSHQLDEALELYNGPFLTGKDQDLGQELEAWFYKTRESIAGRVRQALIRLAERDAQQGEFDIAAKRAGRAYLLFGAPEPEAEDFRRIYRLLQAAGSSRASEVRAEAEAFGLTLELDRDEARRLIAAAPTDPVLPPDNPYKGLDSFGEDDAELFFGRDATIRDLQLAVSSQTLTALVGGSGSGKSSLLSAGLIPAMLQQGDWLIAQMRPGRNPLRSLASALMNLHEPDLSWADHLLESKNLATNLHSGTLSLGEIIEQILRENPARRMLVVVDQFEELYSIGQFDLDTSGSLEPNDLVARELFLEQLFGAVNLGAERFRLVLTVRADFMAQVLAYRPLVDQLQHNQFLLGPMSEAELREAIERPALLRGVQFEGGLVDRILNDVAGRNGHLPLLEFALEQLWEYQQAGWLTHRGYDAIGGVEQALAGYADGFLDGFPKHELAAIQKVFLQLVHPGEGRQDTCRVATRDEIGEENWPLVSSLATQRLLVTARDESGEQTAEVIHEALIHSWSVLRGWVDEHRAFRVWQERLRQEMRFWLSSGQDEGVLLRGYYLEEASTSSMITEII